MKRILVIGGPGAGKSTLSRKIADALGLPLVHLDQLFWSPGWVQIPKDDYLEAVLEAMKAESWVMDGNCVSTLARRLKRADVVVFLDFPTGTGCWRVLKRTVRGHGKVRPDMSEDCPERFDWEFGLYILRFRRDVRPVVEVILGADSSGKVVRCKNQREVDSWFEATIRPSRQGTIDPAG